MKLPELRFVNILRITLAIAFVGGALTTAYGWPSQIGTLSIEQLRELIDGGRVAYIFDANPRESYLEAHIPGAQWVPYDAVATAVLPSSKDAMLVFYCYNPQCGASHVAANGARVLGYHNAWVMAAGILGWRTAGLPVKSGPEPK